MTRLCVKRFTGGANCHRHSSSECRLSPSSARRSCLSHSSGYPGFRFSCSASWLRHFIPSHCLSLIVGTELLAWSAPGIHRLALMSTSFLFFMPLGLLIWLLYEPLAALTAANLLFALFAVPFARVFTLGQRVEKEKGRDPFWRGARK